MTTASTTQSPASGRCLFGVLWTTCGADVAFGAGAALSLGATVLLFAVVRR